MSEGRAARACVPQEEPEVGGTDEGEAVGLVDMLVRATRDAGQSRGDVHHDRPEVLLQLVVAEDLDQPASLVIEELQGPDLDPFDLPVGVCSCPARSPPPARPPDEPMKPAGEVDRLDGFTSISSRRPVRTRRGTLGPNPRGDRPLDHHNRRFPARRTHFSGGIAEGPAIRDEKPISFIDSAPRAA